MLTPINSVRSFRFCTLAARATDVELIGNFVHGRWKGEVREYYGPHSRHLIEDFLNSSNAPDAILRFTRKYGSLYESPVSGREFRFHVHVWKSAQTHFRSLWTHLSDFPDWQPEGGSLAYRNGFLTYTAANLYMFLYMDLVTCPATRVRKCKREDCLHPYFVARHLKQRFCTEICAEWGQRGWKKQWWNEHGQSWRAERRRKIKEGGQNVTRKTR
jgi:hypothetical protein